MNDLLDTIESAFFGLLLLLVAVLLVLMFVYLPLSVINDGRCLDQGYPKSAITWNLHTYCLGFAGEVHPVVVRTNPTHKER